jgi:hypothetical protein
MSTPAEKRAALALEVFNRVFHHTDTFRQEHLGADLAYLLGAILDAGEENGRSHVDWSPENSDCADTLARFRKLFPAGHPVWQHILTQDQPPQPL